MNQLERTYGDFDVIYHGDGKVNGHGCKFSVGQKADGRICIFCQHSGRIWDSVSQYRKIRLEGDIKEGRRVVIEGYFADHAPEDEIELLESVVGAKMTIGTVENRVDVKRIAFGITNFRFSTGESEYDLDTYSITLKHALHGYEYEFRRIAKYREAVRKMHQLTTQTTCHLVVDVADHSVEELTKFADSICNLLTLARGKKTNYINYVLLNAIEEPIQIVYESRFTDPKQGLMLYREPITRFLEDCYPKYVEMDGKYRIRNFVDYLVQAYSTPFPESNCLIVFSAVEVLSRQARKKGSFRAVLRDFVDNFGVSIATCKAKKCGHACRQCKPKCKECRSQCEPECEIGQFVMYRNQFVHGLEFSDQNVLTVPFWAIHFYQVLLLRLLGYTSEYINWSTGCGVMDRLKAAT